ncbi:hypothetical protein M9Y10_000808 [Tritrichomonas musculus]|uniref:Uncharacterized protein n=1 Tax=Tritrichomonas musculus TaxID=1915356 RepID=A0ABR2L6X6_9EUKA
MHVNFICCNKQYTIDYKDISLLSTFFLNQKDGFQENLNLFSEFENISENPEESIKEFFNYLTTKHIELNPSTVITIYYLSQKYHISDLTEITEKYISANIYSIFDAEIKGNDLSFQTEEFLVKYFHKLMKDDRLIYLPLPTLHRILRKFSNKENNRFLQENGCEIIDFILKCHKAHGESASILFNSLEFNFEMREYMNKRLLEEKYIIGNQMIQSVMIENLIYINSRNQENQKKEIEQMKEKYEMKINEIEEKCNKALMINRNQKKEIEQMKEKYEMKINEIEELYGKQINEILSHVSPTNKTSQRIEEAKKVGDKMKSLTSSSTFSRTMNRIQSMPTKNQSKSSNKSFSSAKEKSDQSISLLLFDSLDQEKTTTTADFTCYINNTCLIENVKIDTSSDIKTQIARQFNLQTSQFDIDSVTKEKNNNFFHLTILKPYPNIKFQFPSFSCVINDCYEKSFNEVIYQFYKQNIFFSRSLFSFIRFKLWGIKIPISDFCFNCIPEGTTVYVEPANIVTLNCQHLTFNFIENETVASVVDLIEEIYKKFTISVSIKHNQCNIELDRNDTLKCNNHYFVQILYNFTFVSKQGKLFDKKLNFFMTVSEAKALIAKLFSKCDELKPDFIIIYGNNNITASDHYRLIDSLTYNTKIDKKIVYFDIQYQVK